MISDSINGPRRPDGRTRGRPMYIPRSKYTNCLNKKVYVGFEVFTAMVIKSIIFWDMTPCTLLATCLLAGSCWNYFFDPEDGGYVPPKCRLQLRLHGVISQKMILFKKVCISPIRRISQRFVVVQKNIYDLTALQTAIQVVAFSFTKIFWFSIHTFTGISKKNLLFFSCFIRI
jgi:hypothetical protein